MWISEGEFVYRTHSEEVERARFCKRVCISINIESIASERRRIYLEGGFVSGGEYKFEKESFCKLLYTRCSKEVSEC